MRASKVLSTEKIPVSNVLSLGSEVEHGGKISRPAEKMKRTGSKVFGFSGSINPFWGSKKGTDGIKR